QNSNTPFHDVVELATAIARAKGLDASQAQAAGRISLGIFFAETNGTQNMGNARSNKYKGSLQSGVSEDQSGQRRWAAIKPSIAAFDPALNARDDKEEARAGNLDHRYNHWTAVRDALMNAHADVFPHIPAIVKALPNPIDQMKLFELIQIIPSPTRSALKSGNLAAFRVSDPTVMAYLRNNSIFTFGRADRVKTSATYGEILEAMWLFNDKFERALSKFNEIKTQQKRWDSALADLASSAARHELEALNLARPRRARRRARLQHLQAQTQPAVDDGGSRNRHRGRIGGSARRVRRHRAKGFAVFGGEREP